MLALSQQVDRCQTIMIYGIIKILSSRETFVILNSVKQIEAKIKAMDGPNHRAPWSQLSNRPEKQHVSHSEASQLPAISAGFKILIAVSDQVCNILNNKYFRYQGKSVITPRE